MEGRATSGTEAEAVDLSDEALLALVAGAALPEGTNAPAATANDAAAGPARTGRAAALREALRRMAAGRHAIERPSLRCSADVYRLFGPRLARRTHERFVVVALDARNRPRSQHLVAQGSLASCIVHPREVFAPLVRRRAAAALLLHNHPSGDPTPSPEDERLTERLAEAGRILGIPILDHLVVVRDGYVSLRDSRPATLEARSPAT